MVWGNVRQLELMTARRDFTDIEILEVGQCFQLCGKHSSLCGTAISRKSFAQSTG